jgi:hypothetical protein
MPLDRPADYNVGAGNVNTETADTQKQAMMGQQTSTSTAHVITQSLPHWEHTASP